MNKETDTDKGLVAEWLKAMLRIRRMMEPTSSLKWFINPQPLLRWLIDSKQKLTQPYKSPFEGIGGFLDVGIKAKMAEKHADFRQQQWIADTYFLEGARFAIFFAAVSVVINSLFWAGAFLILAFVASFSFRWLYWIAFGVSFLMVIAAVFIGCKFRPRRIQSGWAQFENKEQNQSEGTQNQS